MFETTLGEGVLQIHRPETRWLSTGWDGGFLEADAAYNVSVPEGWDCEDLDSYIETRLDSFEAPGPTLLTGVDMCHARAARCGPVVVFATVGLSNPAALPLESGATAESAPVDSQPAGTVNLLVGTTRALEDGALANLVAVTAEAKAATLSKLAAFPGTTSDAVVVATDPAGEPATFSGSATPVGAGARAAVRDALEASFESRYADTTPPETVADAEHGVVTETSAAVFQP